jgi:hypothetical protein
MTKAVPSPYSITLCALISLHSENLESSPLYSGLLDPTKSQEAVQQFLQESLHDGDLTAAMLSSRRVNALLDTLRVQAGLEVSSRLWEWLKIASSSIDALMDLMLTTRTATRAGFVDATSLTGSFVRDVCLGFDELSFEAMTRLWQAFRSQVETAARVSPPHQTARAAAGDGWTDPPEHVELGLRHVLHNVGSFGNVSSSTLASPSNSLGMDLQIPDRMLRGEGTLPSSHLLQFLESTQDGERVESIDALHSYFDRALIRCKDEDKDRQAGVHQHILQFAPILLSALHCQAGNTEMSKLATEEAARVAQHSHDTACVAFALGWLYESGVSSGHSGDMSILKRCSARAAEGNRQNLLTGAEFLMVRQILTSNRRDNKSAARAWDHLMSATSELPSEEAVSIHDRPTRMANIPNARVSLEAMARQRVMASLIWESFGQISAASLSSLVSLQCHSHLSSDDARSAVQNVARQHLFGPVARTLERDKNSDVVNFARLCRTPVGKSNLEGSVFGQAVETIVQLSETHRLPIKDETSREIQLLLHEWAVRRCDFEHAEGLMRLLRSNLRSNESSSLASVRQLQFQEAFMLSQEGESVKASEILKDLISLCKKNGMVAEQGRILLQQAVEHLRSAPEYAVNALGPIVECLSVCESLRLDNFVGAVLSILGQAFFCMKEAELSISTIRAALPALLQSEHVWLQGNAFLTLSKSYLQLAEPPTDSNGSGRKVCAALKYLKRAEALFGSCHDACGLQEVYYLQARLYGSMQNANARNNASDRFVAVSRYISSGNHNANNTTHRSLNSKVELLHLCSRKLPLRV